MTSLTATDLLPVPHSPITCQSSMISHWLIGTRNIRDSGAPPVFAMEPSSIHCAWSQPLAKPQRPLSR